MHETHADPPHGPKIPYRWRIRIETLSFEISNLVPAESDVGGFLAFEFEAVLTPLRSAAGFWSSTVGSKT